MSKLNIRNSYLPYLGPIFDAFNIFFNFKSQIKKNTLCLGFKTGATLWYVLMNRLSYGTRPVLTCLLHNQKLYSGYIRKLSIKLGSRCSTSLITKRLRVQFLPGAGPFSSSFFNQLSVYN